MLVALRPFEIKHLFDFAIRIYRKRFPALFLSLAMVQLPISVAAIALGLQFMGLATDMQELANRGDDPSAGWFLDNMNTFIFLGVFLVGSAFYQLLVMPIGTLTCSRLAACALHGEHPSFGECLRFSLKRYWPTQVALATYALPLLGLAVLMLIIVVIGQATGSEPVIITGAVLGITLIMLGTLVFFFLYFRFFPALNGIIQVSEELPPGGMGSQGIWLLRRAWDLSTGQFWRLLGLSLLAFFAVGFLNRGLVETMNFIVTLLTEIAHGTQSKDIFNNMVMGNPDPISMGISMTIASLVVLIFPPFIQCYQLLLYYDLRCRREAYDLKLLLNNAEVPPAN